MKTRNVLVALALAAAVALGWLLVRRGPTPQGPAAAAAPDAQPASAAGPAGGGKAMPARTGKSQGEAPPAELAVAYDDDPVGSLRLEGQLVDADERPVAGARVVLSSNPRREMRSEGDGSFSFDRLVGRSYSLDAARGDAVATATVRLTAKSEPVVLRLKEVGGLEVTVRAREDHVPVDGAEVKLSEEATASGTTGKDGKVVLRGVAGGFHLVEVSAPGYASAVSMAEASGRPGAVDRQTVELRRGAAASGRVVDPAGKPVAGARVRAVSASTFGPGRATEDVTTDKAGRWAVGALPAGTFHFTARHQRHGPGSSAAVILDGKVEKKDITISLEPGGHLRGQVVRTDGTPVPAAAVRVAVKESGFSTDLARQAFTDEGGRFDLEGLPRRALELVASDESAASDVVPVDLAARPEVLDARIVLGVDGRIAGTVVDDKGQPVPGAQVQLTPELGSKRDNVASWRLRGLAQDVADSGGHFELRGIPDGSYRVRAARTGADPLTLWQRPGVAAKVGDLDLRVVVKDDGRVKGRVLFADGSAPDSFQVTTGFGQGTTFTARDGAFEVDAPAGPVTLAVSGPQFVVKTMPVPEVRPGDATDVGTVTVERGRSISGRVLRPDGTAVAGAKVVGGAQVMGSGSELGGTGFFGGLGGTRSTTSGEDGGYTLVGVGVRVVVLAAETEAEGRSPFVRVPAGETSSQADLVLQHLGALEGKVTAGGQPAGSSMVIATSTQATRGTFAVRTDAGGAYRFDKLAPDTYDVTSMQAGGGGGMSMSMHSVQVTVQSDQVAHLDLDQPAGQISVTVKVATPPAANVHLAQIFLIPGTVAVTTAEQLQDSMAGRKGSSHMGFMMKDQPAQLSGVTPGAYSACVIPVPGDPSDTAAMLRLRDKLEKLITVCVPAQVAASPETQTFTVQVAAVPPLD